MDYPLSSFSTMNPVVSCLTNSTIQGFVMVGLVVPEAQFLEPPLESRPSSYWPWIGGHITKEGIKADLEAMKSSGMRGGNLFDLSVYTPEGGSGRSCVEIIARRDPSAILGRGSPQRINFDQ